MILVNMFAGPYQTSSYSLKYRIIYVVQRMGKMVGETLRIVSHSVLETEGSSSKTCFHVLTHTHTLTHTYTHTPTPPPHTHTHVSQGQFSCHFLGK
jgi:hypothetical protein